MKHIVIKVVLILLFSILVGICLLSPVHSVDLIPETTTNPYEFEFSLLEHIEFKRYQSFDTIEEVELEIEYLLNYKHKLSLIQNSYIGTEYYSRTHLIINPEFNHIDNLINKYNQDIELLKEKELEKLYWENKYNEYPYATQIWLYLKNTMGYNDYVCAGIMGNIMAEVGGQSLHINYTLYDSSGYFYGICQWNRGSYGAVHGTDLETQLNFLKDTIEYELNTYGPAYGFDYNDFVNTSDARQAALAFANAYERCAQEYRAFRANLAMIAYNYFTN